MNFGFAAYHPLLNFSFFAFVLAFSMIFMDPICLLISLSCALIYSSLLKGRKAWAFYLKILLPLIILTAILNPAFNHQGMTILRYLPSGNPLTLESIIYGLAAATMLAAVICWFSCYHQIMTSDKFIYLFGRLIPALSLVLSMVLRFVPRFSEQFKAVAAAQKDLGRQTAKRGLIAKIRQGALLLSIMLSLSLENAIDTADSMRSRGYGLPKRSNFAIYSWQKRDSLALALLLALAIYIIINALKGGLYFNYFPQLSPLDFSPQRLSIWLAYALLCLLPLFIDLYEDYIWKVSQSKI